MKLKRIAIFVGAAAAIILFLGGCTNVKKNAQIENVFDEMFYSVAQPSNTETSFNKVDALRIDHPPHFPEYSSGYEESYYYRQNFLDANKNMSIDFAAKAKRCDISATVVYSEWDSLYLRFQYYPETKTFELEPVSIYTNSDAANPDKTIEEFCEEFKITKSEIQAHQEYFIYEHLLKDWVGGNENESKFGEGNYGDFTIIDNSFDEAIGIP